jgi:hypothetical protein
MRRRQQGAGGGGEEKQGAIVQEIDFFAPRIEASIVATRDGTSHRSAAPGAFASAQE